MTYRPTRVDGISVALIAIATLAGVALRPKLPAEMAVHFSAAGTPDSFLPRPAGIVLLPAVMLATLLILKGVGRFDPSADARVLSVVTLATMGLMAGLHLLVLAWNVGYPVPFDLVLVGVLLWGVLLVGYALVQERVVG